MSFSGGRKFSSASGRFVTRCLLLFRRPRCYFGSEPARQRRACVHKSARLHQNSMHSSLPLINAFKIFKIGFNNGCS